MSGCRSPDGSGAGGRGVRINQAVVCIPGHEHGRGPGPGPGRRWKFPGSGRTEAARQAVERRWRFFGLWGRREAPAALYGTSCHQVGEMRGTDREFRDRLGQFGGVRPILAVRPAHVQGGDIELTLSS